MGNRSWQAILWSLLTIVILLSFMTPFIIFTISFLMIPVLMLYVKSSMKQFVIYYAVSMLIVYLLSSLQGLFLISVSLFFLPPVLVMGNLYKRKAAARSVLTAGTLTLLGESLLSLLVAFLLGFNPIANFKQFMNEYVTAMPPSLKELLPNDQDWYVNLMVQVIPLDLILFSVFFTFLTHGVSRWLLGKTGDTVPGMRPMREWMLPRSFVWIYLIAFVMDLFVNPASSSLIATLLMNLLPILVFVFAVQAIGFLFYIAHVNKWNRVLPIAAIVLFVFMPPLMFVYSLLGVFDVAFPIRERFKKNI